MFWNTKYQHFLDHNIYRAYVIFNLFWEFLAFYLLENIIELFLNIFYPAILGLSWTTKIWRTEKLSTGCFSIHCSRVLHALKMLARKKKLVSQWEKFMVGKKCIFVWSAFNSKKCWSLMANIFVAKLRWPHHHPHPTLTLSI